MTIRKALQSDKAAVCSLLKELNPDVVWHRIFDCYYSSGEPYYGVVLEIDGTIQGFLGTMIADRTVDNKIYQTCNIHSWMVRDKHKSYSLKMITEVLKWDMIFTNYSSSDAVYQILRRMKFTEEDCDFRMTSFRSGSGKIEIYDAHKHGNFLSSEEQKFANNHTGADAKSLILKDGNTRCLIIFKPEPYANSLLLRMRKIPFAGRLYKLIKQYKIEYISNDELFNKHFSSSISPILLKLKGVGIIAKNETLQAADIHDAKKYLGVRRYLYRLPNDMNKNFSPDTLFSEMFIYNLPS